MVFQRLDNGELITVRKPVVVIFGEANIEIGGEVVRCRKVSDSDQSDLAEPPPPVVSDFGLCFPQHELEKKRQHIERHGFTGVEFRQDPRVPESYNVHFSGPEERKRYEKSLGLVNESGTNGGGRALSKQLFEQAAERTKQLFGPAN